MRNLGRFRKAIAIGVLGLVEVAAYIAADPRDLPPWVVTLAAAVNTVLVYWVRNARPVTRADLAREVGPTRFRGRDDPPTTEFP